MSDLRAPVQTEEFVLREEVIIQETRCVECKVSEKSEIADNYRPRWWRWRGSRTSGAALVNAAAEMTDLSTND